MSVYRVTHFLMISMLIFGIRRWKDEKMFEFRIFCQQVSCRSSYRESWMIRNQAFDHENNRQLIHQTMLFLSHSRRCSFKFLTQTDYWVRTEISKCEDHDHSDSSSQCKVKTSRTRQGKQDTSEFLLTCWSQEISMFRERRM